MEYVRLCESLIDFGKLIPVEEDIYNHIASYDKAYYRSTFLYNESHYKRFKEVGSVAGITDVHTDKIYFDFDCKESKHLTVEDARQETVECVDRLLNHGFKLNNIAISFSGNKGFGIDVTTNQFFTPQEIKSICLNIAEGLNTVDTKMYNANRIWRVPGTRHQESGLYKIPLTFKQLQELDVVSIREKASSLENAENLEYNIAEVPPSILALKNKKLTVSKALEPDQVYDLDQVDFKHKPKGFSNCKFAIMNGFFEAGERNDALTIMAATCRAVGYPKEIAYKICLGSAELQAARTGQEPKDPAEIQNSINSVYGPAWKGGQYTCTEDGSQLQTICNRLGTHRCDRKEKKIFISAKQMADHFKDFAVNIEKNRLETGIPLLDDNKDDFLVSTGMVVGLLAAPSAGKTQTTIKMLQKQNQNNVKSAFLSMDMSSALVNIRMIQSIENLSYQKIIEEFKNRTKKSDELVEKLDQNFGKLELSFDVGTTVEDIRNKVIEYNESHEEKLKVLAIDYLECISGPYADATANTGIIAQKLKDIANEFDLCVWLLLQTQKSSGDPSDELLSMRNIKGASVIEQACAMVITLSRPGFNPKNSAEDRFIQISVVKNRMGRVASQDYHWNGLTGNIRQLTWEEEKDLEDLRAKKEEERKAKLSGGFGD